MDKISKWVTLEKQCYLRNSLKVISKITMVNANAKAV